VLPLSSEIKNNPEDEDSTFLHNVGTGSLLEKKRN
jgi:hypothetical protein